MRLRLLMIVAMAFALGADARVHASNFAQSAINLGNQRPYPVPRDNMPCLKCRF